MWRGAVTMGAGRLGRERAVGLLASRSTRPTGSRAACSTLRVPKKLFRPVAVTPGLLELTLGPNVGPKRLLGTNEGSRRRVAVRRWPRARLAR